MNLLRITGRVFRWILFSTLLPTAALMVASCHDPTAPSDSEQLALVRLRGNPDVDRTHRLLALDLRTRRVVGSSESIMYRIVGTAVAPDRESVYAIGTGQGGWKESQIASLDTRTLRIVLREFFAGESGYRYDEFGGMAIGPNHELEVSPDGRRIFIGSAQTQDGEWGVAVLDAATMEAAGFVGLFPDASMVLTMVPPGSFNADGALAVSTGPSPGEPNSGRTIRFVDPNTLEVFEFIDLSAALSTDGDGIALMVPAPNGRDLYLWSRLGWLLKVDLSARQVVARARAQAPPCTRCLTISPDGAHLYLAHTWTHDAPSSGYISVYDADLREYSPIDLSRVQVPRLNTGGTDPPALNRVTVAPDGTLIVATGAMLAQLWGFQSGRLFFLDPSSYEILQTITLDGEVAAIDILVM